MLLAGLHLLTCLDTLLTDPRHTFLEMALQPTLEPPTSVNNQENAPQIGLSDKDNSSVPQLNSLSPGVLRSVSSWQNSDMRIHHHSEEGMMVGAAPLPRGRSVEPGAVSPQTKK